MPSIPEHCLPLNKDLSTYDFNEIQKQLDYMFYVQRVADLLGIEWQELKGNSLTKTNRFDYN